MFSGNRKTIPALRFITLNALSLSFSFTAIWKWMEDASKRVLPREAAFPEALCEAACWSGLTLRGGRTANISALCWSGLWRCMSVKGWIVSSPKFMGWGLNRSISAMTFKKVIKIKWGHLCGPWSFVVSLWEEEIRTQTYTHREKMLWGHREKMAIYKAKRERPQKKPWYLDIRYLDINTRTVRK